MKLRKIIFGGVPLVFLVLQILVEIPSAKAQDKPALELPVELVGFPIIIAAVRMSNFIKKLAYSLNPSTYASRSKRSVESEDMIDIVEAEKRLVEELGEKVCIYPKVCVHHAQRAIKTGGRSRYNIDWDEIFTHYKSPQEKHKESYLLSAFIGDIIGSTKFCNQLAKRGRECKDEDGA